MIPLIRHAEDIEQPHDLGYLREIVAGMKFLWQDRVLVILIIVAALLNFVTNPMAAVILPVFANEQFGSAQVLGILLASFGGGALAGAILYGVIGQCLPRRAVFIGGIAVGAIPFGILATLPTVFISSIALLFLGVATGPLAPIFMTVAQERTPATMRGRIFGLISASVWIVLPLGMLTAGAILELFGLRITFLIQATAFLTLALAVLSMSALRMMEAKPKGSPY